VFTVRRYNGSIESIPALTRKITRIFLFILKRRPKKPHFFYGPGRQTSRHWPRVHGHTMVYVSGRTKRSVRIIVADTVFRWYVPNLTAWGGRRKRKINRFETRDGPDDTRSVPPRPGCTTQNIKTNYNILFPRSSSPRTRIRAQPFRERDDLSVSVNCIQRRRHSVHTAAWREPFSARRCLKNKKKFDSFSIHFNHFTSKRFSETRFVYDISMMEFIGTQFTNTIVHVSRRICYNV